VSGATGVGGGPGSEGMRSPPTARGVGAGRAIARPPRRPARTKRPGTAASHD
jgi:hypothetical protein